MNTVLNSTFENTSVNLDNTSFEGCKFTRCRMVFGGTGPVSLVNCTFNDVSWHMTGPAENTLSFLRAMYHGMGDQGKSIVEATFEQIRSGKGDA